MAISSGKSPVGKNVIFFCVKFLFWDAFRLASCKNSAESSCVTLPFCSPPAITSSQTTVHDQNADMGIRTTDVAGFWMQPSCAPGRVVLWNCVAFIVMIHGGSITIDKLPGTAALIRPSPFPDLWPPPSCSPLDTLLQQFILAPNKVSVH